jgi:FAD-dependent oxidoreductase domain-containing protein 1
LARAAEDADGADVVVVGGGVMGSAVAYFLTADPGFDGTVVVVERDPSYAASTTTRSWGGVRQQFSTPENVRLSLASLAFFREARELLAVDGEGPDLAFKERGYLYLASPAGLSVLQANRRRQCELGAEIALLDRAELAARFPWLSLDGVAAGGFGLSGEGWLDPSALLHGFRRKAQAQGARYLHDEVVAIDRAGAAVRSVALAGGRSLACGHLVNAAGPRAGRLAALAGLALPVGPRKRMTYVFDCRAQLPAMPLVIDTTGMAFRPEGDRFLAILSPPPEDDPESADLAEDYGLFERAIWPALAARVPAFEAIKLTGAWAGIYDYNSLDRNAVIGPHPKVANFHFLNGFSGHGLQQSPAAGRAVAEVIVHGAYRSLDLTALGYGRILEGRPLEEVNVV